MKQFQIHFLINNIITFCYILLLIIHLEKQPFWIRKATKNAFWHFGHNLRNLESGFFSYKKTI